MVLLECLLSALAVSGPSQLTAAESVQVGAPGARGCARACGAAAARCRPQPRPAAPPTHCVRPCLAPPAQRLLGEVFVWDVDEFRCGWVVGTAGAAAAARGWRPPRVRAPHLTPVPSAAVRRRQYCQDEPDWQAAVELLSQDDGAGWQLLADLAVGTRSAAELAASRFCQL